jgi:hypothetical protein
VLGVPTTFIREARRRVSRDEAAKPSESFSKTRRHPFAKRTRLRLLSLNYGRENPKRTRSTQVLDILETTVFLAVTPRRDLSRNNRYERRATIAGSNRVRKIAAPQLL